MTKSVFSDKYDAFRMHLVDARKHADLTQSELSAKLGRPQSYVSKYERRERRLDVIEFFEIAEAIGINPFDFLHNLYENFSQPTAEAL